MSETNAIGRQMLSLLDQVETTIRTSREQAPERAAEAIGGLIEALRACPGVEASDHACHALGYCWYSLPGEGEERLDETEKWLRRALELNPGHQFARVLLGHHFYDQNIYGAAKAQFEKIPPGYFKRFDQHWRDLKVRELIACCDIYRYPEQLAREHVEPVFYDYAQGPPDELIIPMEIVQAVVWAAISVPAGPGIAGAARACLGMIERMNLHEKFAEAVRLLQPMAAAAQP